MQITELGMVKEVSLEQKPNAASPMWVTEEGIVREVSPEQKEFS